ncbi:glycerate kinase [Uliginosibacterium sp. H3]|uniref:Glycerate kinase n=1 Tax=Uliginosibacterium silvisoli TaxID=3114758 RepID=A0ABU6K1E4_9RHOO|nr:glycerate kinase [Uliginosibacterium sp. H3]
MIQIQPRELLLKMAQAAIDAAAPAQCVPENLPAPPLGRTVVIGAGKAAAAMARAVEDHWPWPLSGLVVTRYGHGADCKRIEVIEAAHPVPDEAGQKAAQRILDSVQGLTADDLVLCLISGGGSALLALPAPGLTLADKQQVNRALLRSGASISEMNCVRKHLSAIKGGQLAVACAPARVVTLLISDVPGDDPSVIASGPTIADPTSFADALAIVEKYRIVEPRAVVEHLRRGLNETPKPGDKRLRGNEVRVIATAKGSLEAASRVASEHGVLPIVLGDSIEGEARDVAQVQSVLARLAHEAQPGQKPCVLVSGGETTVTVRGNGRGGRNAEYLLALTCALRGQADTHAIAIDTDGIDGSEDNAGCITAPDTLARAEALGMSADACLTGNDAYSFFDKLEDLVVTGPTRTNVNDFRAILVL